LGDEVTKELIRSIVRAVRELQGVIKPKVQLPLTIAADGTISAVLKDAVAWGSATADWSSGNIVYLHPCDSDGGNANTDVAITGYLVCPTGGSPTVAQVSYGDVLAYLPIDATSGVIINGNMTATVAAGFVGIVTASTPLATPPNSATYSYTVARATKNATGWFAGDSSDGWTQGDSVTAYNMAESDLFYATSTTTFNTTRTFVPPGSVVWVMPFPDGSFWFSFWQQDFVFGRITANGGDGTYTIQPVRKKTTGVGVSHWEDYSSPLNGIVNIAESGLTDNVGNPATYCTPVENNRIVKVYNLLLKNDTATTRNIEAYIDEPPPPICPEYCTGGAQGALLYWDTTANKWKTLCPPGVDSVLSISAAGVLSWLPTTSSCP
jgi:hypothetical protein